MLPRGPSGHQGVCSEADQRKRLCGAAPLGCIVTLTLSLLVAPRTVTAQPRNTVPRIGILTPASEASTPLWEAFRQGLRALGYVEGQNIILEYRLAAGQPERFAALAAPEDVLGLAPA